MLLLSSWKYDNPFMFTLIWVVIKLPVPFSQQSPRVSVTHYMNVFFCYFFWTVSTQSFIHHSVQWRDGRGELHVIVDTMKWLIDYTRAGVIKIHRRGKRHNGRRKCSPVLSDGT